MSHEDVMGVAMMVIAWGLLALAATVFDGTREGRVLRGFVIGFCLGVFGVLIALVYLGAKWLAVMPVHEAPRSVLAHTVVPALFGWGAGVWILHGPWWPL